MIQEIVDTSEKAIHDLTAAVNDNTGAGDSSAGYDVVISPRLGRTSQKEQYAIIYRYGKEKLNTLVKLDISTLQKM